MRLPVLAALLVFHLGQMPAQNCLSTCSGNLGENIFPNGDFGSGAANVLLPDPGLAPGYVYQSFPPPEDGEYVIANDTEPWGGFTDYFWLNLKDNGPEANGYMMIVNASFSPGLFYEKTVEVCENTLYELSMDVISTNKTGPQFAFIKPNVAFLIDGQVVCQTGDVPVDATWRTVRFSFTTGPGTTAVTLSLRNNAPGGFGNDLAIDNISFRACGPQIDVPLSVVFCPGKPIEIQSNLLNSPYTNPAFLWQRREVPGPWLNVPNPSGTTLHIDDPQDGQSFRLVVANSTANLALPNCRAVSAPIDLVLEDLSAFAITGEDTIVCNGAPATLEAGAFSAYLWSSGATTPSILAGIPGWYAVTVTSSHDCVATDSLYVQEVRLEATASGRNPECFGESSGAIDFTGISGGVGPLVFAASDTVNSPVPLLAGLPAGTYTATVVDSLGCRVAETVVLTDPPQLRVDLGPDLTVLQGDSIRLEAQVNFTVTGYEWRLPERVSCDCPVQTPAPFLPVEIFVEVVDSSGCRAVDSVAVAVLPQLDLYAPNVFWADPLGNDGDGFFTVFPSTSASLIRRLAVYDRWGGLVFLRENATPGAALLQWDGTGATGKRVAGGVYAWMAEVEFFDGSLKVYSGNVTVLSKN